MEYFYTECPNCGIDVGDVGYIWCPDCGQDLIIKHRLRVTQVIKQTKHKGD